MCGDFASYLAEQGGLELCCGVAGVKELTEGHLETKNGTDWLVGGYIYHSYYSFYFLKYKKGQI